MQGATYPNIRDMFSSALPPFQKDVTTRQPLQLTFKAVSPARTTNLSFKVGGVSGVELARVQVKSNERSCPCLKW